MNRNRFRLVFSHALRMMVPVAETARSRCKADRTKPKSCSALALTGVLLWGNAQAEIPVASANFAAPGTTANYQFNAMQAWINQVGNRAVVNFDKFNISAGYDVRFQQVDSLASGNLVPDANFSVLGRIHDNNPSIIAGSISQGAGQKANVILVNSNGIAFLGGSQVNLNSFTASTLNIQDNFLDNFLPGTSAAQFENALDGSAARGFIKVFEGARITAGSQGRVMLIAPTVVNKGTVTAPDGQVIAAAGTKAYLRSASAEDESVRGLLVEVDSPAGLSNFETPNPDVKDGMLDGHAVSLVSASEDKLGHVTNLGELSTPRGNVTMVGYAVNQQGIARATTSVVANGSVYLLAKDTKTVNPLLTSATNIGSSRAGRVLLGDNSLTEILPDVADSTGGLDGTTGTGLAKASQFKVLGKDIRMTGSSRIHAPSAAVEIKAVDNPSNPQVLRNADQAESATARIHVASGARIDVAGLGNVQVSAARNGVEVELRGDELKDTPVNQQGPLRGEKVYVDISRALANANAGKSTLIAKDSLESYQAKLERTVAERSTAGGQVNILSEGETILERGVVFDLSGGSVKYTAANVKTTLLTAGGKLVDIVDANAATRYDDIATRYVIDYGRWNKKEVIDLGQSFRYDPGYTEGKNAGSLDVVGMKAVVMQADIQGRTTVGELQREAGIAPSGARLTIGLRTQNAGKQYDYKQNQRVEIGSTGAPLPVNFKFGDELVQTLKDTLVLNPALMGENKVAQLQVFSNEAAVVRDTLRAPTGGSVAITAEGIAVKADIHAPAGAVSLVAHDNLFDVNPASLDVTVDDGVSLTARGDWANDLPGATGKNAAVARVDGGAITLATERGNVALGRNSLIDVSGGAQVKPNGKLKNGNGGNVTLEAGQTGQLGGEVRGYALGKGGTYTLKTDKIQIGGAFDPAAMSLDAAFFERGGFADFKLTGANGVEIANGVTLRPTVISRELQPGYTLQPTGSNVEAFSYLVKRDDRVRQTANLSFTSGNQGSKIRVGENAKILADDNAKISFSAHTSIDLLGEVKTAGGNITAITTRKEGDTFDPSAAVWLGSKSVLDVSGAARTYSDSRGLTQGNVLAGGNVTLGGQTYVVSEAGSRINVSGAAPVRLDVPNETGGLGRMVGSNAGSITISTTEGALLDGAVEAHAGSATSRGSAFSLTMPTINYLARQSASSPINSRVLSLAQTVAAQATGLAPGDAVPNALNGNTRIGVQNLTAAGFERFRFNSKNGAIRLEDGLDAGGGRAVPLRELTLDAPRIETAGGNAALTADTVRLGNYSPPDSPDNTPLVPESASPVASGTLAVNARQIELAGKLTLAGMARAEFNGAEEIRLVGGFPDNRERSNLPKIDVRPLGELKTGADLVFHGAVVAPATYVHYSILAPGRTVSFTQGTQAPRQPWSAYGSLTVQAGDIVQGGTIWAPLGKIDLQAENTLTLLNGSLTSVAAAPDSLIPFGKLVNGRNWVFDLGVDETDSIAVDDLEKKSILTRALKVDMQPGAKVNLSGGGDVQGYEFSVGPGGSNDILAQQNIYAILPAYQGGFAPTDAQEKFDRASAEAVYLSGVPGLKDGVYTLLPAHYALLPGAYAVKLDSGINDILPGQAYSRQDGVRIAAGYVTDTRASAPRDARWQGVQVLTHEQVRARSEFTLTRASQFFADSRNRPQDAGLLSVSTTGTGADALKLDAVYDLAAGQGGRGAQVDISALKLAVTSGSPTGIAPDVVALETDKLNALGADSLFIGGTRTTSGDTTTLIVNADTVTLANDADHALQAPEVILAAKDTVTLKSGSLINAQGAAGDAGHYEAEGEGALLRAASTTASFARTGSPGNTQGTLVGEVGSRVIAAASITLDATKENAFNGIQFKKNDAEVTGTLEVGAPRINFGMGGMEGISYSQTELNALSSLKGLTLTSYSTFDVYGEVSVGGVGTDGKPTLQNLILQGAGLAGINNSGTVNLRAQNLTLSNPASAAYTPGKTVAGSGALAILTDTLTLGIGAKEIQGFSAVTVTANELIGSGKGSLKVAAPVTLNVARISGERGANQAFDSAGAMKVAQHTADRVLAPVTALGAKWALAGTSVDFDSKVELPSGAFKLVASGGNVDLGAHAKVDVAGRTVQFFDVSKPSWGGKAEFISDTGNVVFAAGSTVDVSAAAGGDAGTLIVRAAKGETILADGSVNGQAAANDDGKRGEGARVDIDTDKLASFSALNTALNSGGFDGARTLRVRTDDVRVAESDSVKALDIKIAADNGKLDVAGVLDASGEDAGRIELFAKDDVNVSGTARFNARSSGVNEDGGDIVFGTRDGRLNLAVGSTIDVTGGAGGQGGDVLLRAPRIDNHDADTLKDNVGITALASTISGAKTVRVEGFAVYNDADNSVQAADFDPGSTWYQESQTFMANLVDTRTDLGIAADSIGFKLLPGIEIQSATDLALTDDWSLHTWRYDPNTGAVVTDAASLNVGLIALDLDGKPTPQSKPLLAGVLTLRAQGHLNINGSLSDGFDQATAKSGTTPAALLGGDSWSYRLIAGADSAAADPLAVKPGDKNFTLAAGKLIRTGTGNIQTASGNHINLVDDKAVIYTAGSASGNLSGFTPPVTKAAAFFSQGGGDVSLAAIGDIVGSPSKQLFNNWLFRQGSLNDNASAYVTQTAWWVRFDQFQQGVGALGGGDVTLRAGGEVKNLSAHAPTQARMASVIPNASSLHQTGGGTVRVEAGADILGGQYYADRGDVVLNAGGKVDSGQAVSDGALYTILALGDGQARVRAQGDVNIEAVLNPHLLNQSGSQSQATSKSIFNLPGSNSGLESLFSTYGDSSSASLFSLYGTTTLKLQNPDLIKSVYGKTLHDQRNSTIENLNILPSSLSLVAFQGDVSISDPIARSQLIMLSSPNATLELLAHNSLNMYASSIFMSDRERASIPNAVLPNSPKLSTGPSLLGLNDKTHPAFHAPVPIHVADLNPVRVYAVEGDISGASQAVGAPTLLDVPKAFVVQAGRDVINLSIEAQHVNASNDHSRVQAGRDIVFSTGATRTDGDHIYLGGPGTLDVIAGRDIDLGTSGGIISRGNNVNPALADQGADIRLAAGVGPKGVDYAGALDRLIAKLEAGADDTTLWHARWLTGDSSLTAGNALAAVRAVEALDAEAQQTSVRSMLFTALRETGRDTNKEDSPYAGDYARGYAAIELIFPGIRETNPDGSFKHYQGDINLFASRVKTESGGNIEWLAPGGDMIVGLANTPSILVDPKILSAEGGGGVLGIVAAEKGDIKGFSRGDVRVNQSRILAVGGGGVLLWSSEGDIDAGKGKKTATAVPPPLIKVDSKGNVTLELQGAATGSGIGALQPAGGIAGDVDLIAPEGAIDAGDAGIRAGNLNIAAQVVIGADNITVSGSATGTPVEDTSAVSAASSGASNADGGVASATAALSQGLSEAARSAEELKKFFKPTFISAEVIGHGDCEPGEKPPCPQK